MRTESNNLFNHITYTQSRGQSTTKDEMSGSVNINNNNNNNISAWNVAVD